MKSKTKIENITFIKTCPTTVQQHDTTKKKKTLFKKSQLFQITCIPDNNINVKVDNGNTKRKQIQCKFKFKSFFLC